MNNEALAKELLETFLSIKVLARKMKRTCVYLPTPCGTL